MLPAAAAQILPCMKLQLPSLDRPSIGGGIPSPAERLHLTKRARITGIRRQQDKPPPRNTKNKLKKMFRFFFPSQPLRQPCASTRSQWGVPTGGGLAWQGMMKLWGRSSVNRGPVGKELSVFILLLDWMIFRVFAFLLRFHGADVIEAPCLCGKGLTLGKRSDNVLAGLTLWQG